MEIDSAIRKLSKLTLEDLVPERLTKVKDLQKHLCSLLERYKVQRSRRVQLRDILPKPSRQQGSTSDAPGNNGCIDSARNNVSVTGTVHDTPNRAGVHSSSAKQQSDTTMGRPGPVSNAPTLPLVNFEDEKILKQIPTRIEHFFKMLMTSQLRFRVVLSLASFGDKADRTESEYLFGLLYSGNIAEQWKAWRGKKWTNGQPVYKYFLLSQGLTEQLPRSRLLLKLGAIANSLQGLCFLLKSSTSELKAVAQLSDDDAVLKRMQQLREKVTNANQNLLPLNRVYTDLRLFLQKVLDFEYGRTTEIPDALDFGTKLSNELNRLFKGTTVDIIAQEHAPQAFRSLRPKENQLAMAEAMQVLRSQGLPESDHDPGSPMDLRGSTPARNSIRSSSVLSNQYPSHNFDWSAQDEGTIFENQYYFDGSLTLES